MHIYIHALAHAHAPTYTHIVACAHIVKICTHCYECTHDFILSDPDMYVNGDRTRYQLMYIHACKFNSIFIKCTHTQMEAL